MERVAFLGLGRMGAPMAWNLRRAGVPLVVWNRTKGKTGPFRREGVPVATSPAEAAREADVIALMLSDGPAVREVLFGPEGVEAGLRPGQLVVDMSTIGPDEARDHAARLADLGVAAVDAPVSGTVGPAKEGKLLVFAGGEDAHVARAAPLFEAVGRKVVRAGPLGHGMALKLLVKLNLGAAVAALAETLAAAERAGLRAGVVLEALGESPVASAAVKSKGEAMAADRYETSFPVSLMTKDLGLVLRLADSLGSEAPVARAALGEYERAEAKGFGKEDFAAVLKAHSAPRGLRKAQGL
jgi:3-hydroxyisobutyrate dehydrogenase